MGIGSSSLTSRWVCCSLASPPPPLPGYAIFQRAQFKETESLSYAFFVIFNPERKLDPVAGLNELPLLADRQAKRGLCCCCCCCCCCRRRLDGGSCSWSSTYVCVSALTPCSLAATPITHTSSNFSLTTHPIVCVCIRFCWMSLISDSYLRTHTFQQLSCFNMLKKSCACAVFIY